MGRSALRRGDYLTATRYFINAVNQDLTDGRAYLHLGFAFALLGESSCALDAFDIAFDLEETPRGIFVEAAFGMGEMGKAKEGAALLREALHRHYPDNDIERQTVLACLRSLEGDLPGCELHLRYAAEWKPDHPAILSALTDVLMQQQKYQEARRALQSLVWERHGGAFDAYRMGVVEECLARVDAARLAYQLALMLDPGFDSARNALCKLEWRRRRFLAAAWHYGLQRYYLLTVRRPRKNLLTIPAIPVMTPPPAPRRSPRHRSHRLVELLLGVGLATTAALCFWGRVHNPIRPTDNLSGAMPLSSAFRMYIQDYDDQNAARHSPPWTDKEITL